MAERIQARAVANITGLSLRTVQLMAERGEIPSAAKIGSRWTFDEATIRRWVRHLEAETCQTTFTGAATYGGRGSRFEGATFDEAYERLLGARPRSA